jgi:DNA-binding transcriptional LysR family regulator
MSTSSPRRLDLDNLRAFAEVATRLSFLEAAEALALSPSALTRRIKRLEADLGLLLLERTTRRVTLSRAGRQLLPRAEQVLAGVDDCLACCAALATAGADELTIACVPTIARGLLPRLISRYSQRWPEVRIRIIEAHVATILRKLHNGEADLGIGFMPTPDPGLVLDELLVDPYDLACPKEHPLAALPEVSWADLKRHALIVSGNGRTSGNRQVLDGVLSALDWEPGRLVQIEHLSTALGLVEAGLGITVVPRSALTPELRERLAIRPLNEPRVTRTIGVIRRRAGPLTAAAKNFRLTLRRLAPLDETA